MKCKICGLFDPENIKEVISLSPDYIGFIFYRNSPRNVALQTVQKITDTLSSSIHSVGVFVNESVSCICDLADTLNLNAVQLHGENSIQTAAGLRKKNFKAEIFIAATVLDIKECNNLSINDINYIVFDSSTPGYGGSGMSFDWLQLSAYTGDIPFFLSGGIGPHNLQQALQFNHPQFAGIDMNSRLESEDNKKDLSKVETCISLVRNYENR